MENTITLTKRSLVKLVKTAVREALEEKVSQLRLRDNDEFIPAAEVCKRYHISRPTLALLQRRGMIKVYKLNGKNFYKKSEIDETIQNSRSQYERNFN